MANQMGGMAGAVQVSWPEAEENEGEEGQDEKEDCPSCKDAENILKNIEEGGDLDDNKEEISDLLSNGNPKITAVGVDFPMLLHETVKGIYQLIGAAWLPAMGASEKDIKKAEIIKTATSSFEDEAEDFRYGPYLAAALRDFINTCPNVDRYPNIREYVWGDMCYMAQTKEGKKQFLELFKGILEKTDKAKKQITEMINDIIDRIKEYEISQIDEPQTPEYSELEPGLLQIQVLQKTSHPALEFENRTSLPHAVILSPAPSTCLLIFLLHICLSPLLTLLKLIAWLVSRIMVLMFVRLLCAARQPRNTGPLFMLIVKMVIVVKFMLPFHPQLVNQLLFLGCTLVVSRLIFLFVTPISFHLFSLQKPIYRFLVLLRRKILFFNLWNGTWFLPLNTKLLMIVFFVVVES